MPVNVQNLDVPNLLHTNSRLHKWADLVRETCFVQSRPEIHRRMVALDDRGLELRPRPGLEASPSSDFEFMKMKSRYTSMMEWQ